MHAGKSAAAITDSWARVGEPRDILLDRSREEFHVLGQIAIQLLRSSSSSLRRLSHRSNLACERLPHVEEDAQQGGFAATARSDQGQNRTGGHFKTDIAKNDRLDALCPGERRLRTRASRFPEALAASSWPRSSPLR